MLQMMFANTLPSWERKEIKNIPNGGTNTRNMSPNTLARYDFVQLGSISSLTIILG